VAAPSSGALACEGAVYTDNRANLSTNRNTSSPSTRESESELRARQHTFVPLVSAVHTVISECEICVRRAVAVVYGDGFLEERGGEDGFAGDDHKACGGAAGVDGRDSFIVRDKFEK